MTPVLQITSAADREGFVVRVEGELDLSGIPQLERALAVAGRVSAARVMLDLERLTFVDGAAIGALLSAARWFAREEIAFRVNRAGGQVERILVATGATAQLPIFEGRSEAPDLAPVEDHRLPRPFGVDFLSEGTPGRSLG